MTFQPGREKTGGRQAGTPNKKTLLRAAFVLAEMGFSPAEELAKIAQDEKTPLATRVELCKFLQTYVEAPQTKPTEVAPETPAGSLEAAKATMDKLAALSRPLDPGNPPPASPQP